ncbi:carbonic anhydrase [Chelativorans alearense]|uniref:carbonic anhydrase n=1 Tax=Chelativorans alearense TaxID=2681495 RepID=UPI0013D8B55E|nr:carbonic anhydrase [Chelativorans alearense]
MERRNFIKGFIALGACPVCAKAASAAGNHWSYSGGEGPRHWAELDRKNFVCSGGTQQSPVDVSGTIEADLPPISIGWHKGGGVMVNNGHTIQINMPAGSTLGRGGRKYDLLQFHFHAPSEHHVEGRTFPMEAHFVHKDRDTGALGVLAVFLTPGAANTTFAGLAAAFPAQEGAEVSVDKIDPNGLLPTSLRYWTYEGSLTTPPCSENVDWMVAREPVEVTAADIERFTAIYPANARPIVSQNRRFILSSH